MGSSCDDHLVPPVWKSMSRAVLPVLLATLLVGVVFGALLSTAGRTSPPSLGPPISVELQQFEPTDSPSRGDRPRRRNRPRPEPDGEERAPREPRGKREGGQDRAAPEPEPEPEPEPQPELQTAPPVVRDAPITEHEPPPPAFESGTDPSTHSKLLAEPVPESDPQHQRPEADIDAEVLGEGPSETDPKPGISAEPEPQEPDTERAHPRQRARAQFREGFAEAWARADDPTPAVLPEASEITAALNATRDEPQASVDAAADGPPLVEAVAQRLDAAEPEPASSPEIEPAPQPSWDRERYSTQIDAPDWWTPDMAEEATPSKPSESSESSESAGSPVSTAPESDWETNPPSEAPRPASSAVSATKPHEPYAGEETMLWFGRRPGGSELDEWPAEDAAGEIEVASTGRRGVAEPPGAAAMPGSQELDDALAALDATGPARPSVGPAPQSITPSEQSPALPAPPPSPQQLAVRSSASRAYRRLRRIFPG